jgi:hypothetical protein
VIEHIEHKVVVPEVGKEKVSEPEKVENKIEKKFFKGSFALYDKERKIKPMVVNDLELELECENLEYSIYRFVKKNDVKLQDVMEKIEKKEECVETEKSVFEDPVAKKSEESKESKKEEKVDDLVDLEKGVSEKTVEIITSVEKTGKELLVDFLKSKNIGNAFNPKDLLDHCEQLLKKQPQLMYILKNLSRPLSRAGAPISTEKLQEILESSVKALTTVCDSALGDNKNKKKI